MTFSSKIQVLKVDVLKGNSKKTNLPFEIHTAECILLNDDGSVNQVGKLRIPQSLRESCVPGTFSAGFSLGVSNYGDTRGLVEAQLASLTPLVKSMPAPPAGSASKLA
jgi:hypothetical protein